VPNDSLKMVFASFRSASLKERMTGSIINLCKVIY
jgi:hypothetical protein